MLRHILIRPTGASRGGDLMGYTASELAGIYSADELARLTIGLPVHRDGVTHIDLLAFHDRHATPDLRGSILLRRLMRFMPFTAPAMGEVAA